MISVSSLWNDLNIFSRVLIVSSVRKQKGEFQNWVLFYTPENKKKRKQEWLCSSYPVTLLKKIFIVIFKGFWT